MELGIHTFSKSVFSMMKLIIFSPCWLIARTCIFYLLPHTVIAATKGRNFWASTMTIMFSWLAIACQYAVDNAYTRLSALSFFILKMNISISTWISKRINHHPIDEGSVYHYLLLNLKEFLIVVYLITSKISSQISLRENIMKLFLCEKPSQGNDIAKY